MKVERELFRMIIISTSYIVLVKRPFFLNSSQDLSRPNFVTSLQFLSIYVLFSSLLLSLNWNLFWQSNWMNFSTDTLLFFFFFSHHELVILLLNKLCELIFIELFQILDFFLYIIQLFNILCFLFSPPT